MANYIIKVSEVELKNLRSFLDNLKVRDDRDFMDLVKAGYIFASRAELYIRDTPTKDDPKKVCDEINSGNSSKSSDSGKIGNDFETAVKNELIKGFAKVLNSNTLKIKGSVDGHHSIRRYSDGESEKISCNFDLEMSLK